LSNLEMSRRRRAPFPCEAAQMCAATPVHEVLVCDSSDGPDVGAEQPGKEQALPARAARLKIVILLKSSRTVFLHDSLRIFRPLSRPLSDHPICHG
jgi:hypothetical protein